MEYWSVVKYTLRYSADGIPKPITPLLHHSILP
jgi:hypothetical protein